ncbi:MULTISPECIES: helix-turn-helix transcriptional regulator [Actinosynnema]|uniref:helix-turn-helix transcriptional regulator n=1 Tax=Actinosynnema TaxID=40566 RepID=UPI0020A59AC3|nr:helix-turn-helix transcriptional regulator [Actinosynnema pretiosum]MCP2094587.1 regulatory protein, luxR family [Actinosynnema pretiosum]
MREVAAEGRFDGWEQLVGLRVVGVGAASREARDLSMNEWETLGVGLGMPVLRARVDNPEVPYGGFMEAIDPASGEHGEMLRKLFRKLDERGWARIMLGLTEEDVQRVVRAALVIVGGETGVVLALDDVHHADARTIGLLEYLADSAARVLLVLGHDPLNGSPRLAALLAKTRNPDATERLARIFELPPDRAGYRLTRREATVLEGVAQGLTDDTIADRLAISPRTVHRRLRHVSRKLGTETEDREEVVELAKSAGLLPGED